jgi:hypothetical protein
MVIMLKLNYWFNIYGLNPGAIEAINYGLNAPVSIIADAPRYIHPAPLDFSSVV